MTGPGKTTLNKGPHEGEELFRSQSCFESRQALSLGFGHIDPKSQITSYVTLIKLLKISKSQALHL